jgi:hypothetical protein
MTDTIIVLQNEREEAGTMILKEKELKVLNTLSVPIIIIIYLGFIYLTYNPPHKFIFFDILNEKYGINEYKKITKYR